MRLWRGWKCELKKLEQAIRPELTFGIRPRNLLREYHRLHSGNLKAFPAAHVLAGHEIVFAQHVGAGFGEAGAVALVGASGKLALLGADHPGYFILGRLVAVWAVQ